MLRTEIPASASLFNYECALAPDETKAFHIALSNPHVLVSKCLFNHLFVRRPNKSLLKKKIFIEEKEVDFRLIDRFAAALPLLRWTRIVRRPSPWHTSAGSLGKDCGSGAFLCEAGDSEGWPLHVMNIYIYIYTAIPHWIWRWREHRPQWWGCQIVFPWSLYSTHANVSEMYYLPEIVCWLLRVNHPCVLNNKPVNSLVQVLFPQSELFLEPRPSVLLNPPMSLQSVCNILVGKWGPTVMILDAHVIFMS